MITTSEPLLMTREQACRRYALSLRKFDQLVQAGVVPAIRIGRRGIRIPVQKADEAFLALSVGGKARHD